MVYCFFSENTYPIGTLDFSTVPFFSIEGFIIIAGRPVCKYRSNCLINSADFPENFGPKHSAGGKTNMEEVVPVSRYMNPPGAILSLGLTVNVKI